jgi:hypothetical protein
VTRRTHLLAALLLAGAALGGLSAAGAGSTGARPIELSVLGTYSSGVFADGAQEIVAYDAGTKRLFVVNAGLDTVDILDASDPSAPTKFGEIDTQRFGSPNSVDVHDGLVAVALEADPKTDPGTVAFFDADGAALASVEVGALPDMLTFSPNGRLVLVANEGEPNDDYSVDPEGSVSIIDLKGGVASLSQDDVRTAGFGSLTEKKLERLTVSLASGDTDGDGDYDELHAFGARSFTIWSENGKRVFDSGDALERLTSVPGEFNSTNEENASADTRSDNKGPEPEGIALGVVGRRVYAFVGLERIGGVMVWDVTNPHGPRFVQYLSNRDFAGDPEAGTAGDLGPEGLRFIGKHESPTGVPLLAVANEVSGTTTLYRIEP